MIIRKPYAFLIKHFKLIHLILAALFFYLAVRTYQLHSFIVYYISENWVERFNFSAGTYIDSYIFLAITVVVLIAASVMRMMKKKEKPVTYYLVTIIGYLFMFVLFMYFYSILYQMETKEVGSRLTNVIEDLSLMAFMFQIVIIILTLIRGLGFDIKKFNFGEDIEELKEEMGDSEEIELAINFDPENALTNLRKKKREFKYLYQENKFIIDILGVLSVLIIALIIFLNMIIFNKVYKEDETFRAGNFNVTVTDTFVTKENYRGYETTNDSERYLIVKLKVTNISDETRQLNYKNYRLLSGASSYTPNLKKYSQLFDIGYGYTDENIDKGETKEYILVYVIDKRSLNNKIILRYTNNIRYYVGSFTASYKKVRLTTEDLDKKSTVVSEVKLKEELSFKGSLLEDTTISIKSFQVKNKLNYTYEYCLTRDDCQTLQGLVSPSSNSNYDKTILALETNINLGETVYLRGVESAYDFISKLTTLKYKIGDKIKTQSVDYHDCTPTNYKGDIVYLEVIKEVEKASEIELVFLIRDKRYVYNIK